MTLNRHHGLLFDVVGVAPTAIMYHWFNCDKKKNPEKYNKILQ